MWQEIAIYIIAFLIIIYVGKKIFKLFTSSGEKNCNCGCGTCPLKDKKCEKR